MLHFHITSNLLPNPSLIKPPKMSMEEKNPEISMARAGKIIRKSVFTFLQHYQYFTSIAALLALPFSLSVLLSQALFPPSFSLYAHLIPSSSSAFFSLVSLKLSQSISSFILTLPFSLSFLLFAKAAAFNPLIRDNIYHHNQLPLKSLWGLYSALLSTHLWSSLLIFCANAACLSLLFLGFSYLEEVGNTAPWWGTLVLAMGAVLYSIVMTNAMVLCTMALAYSGVERRGGFKAIICTYSIIRSRTSTALALAVPTGLGLAAVEALFHFRIIKSSYENENDSSRQLWLLALEALLIAYLYSIILVLDVIMSCFFYQSCKGHGPTETRVEVEEDGDGYHYDNSEKLKGLEEFV